MAALSSFLRKALIIAGVLVLAGIAYLYSVQRDLIYPGAGGPAGWDAGHEGFETISLVTADGLTLNALYRPAATGADTIIFFHGNGGDASYGSSVVAPALREGQGALLVEYRGYAGNPGKPDEAGLYRDARAGIAFLESEGVAPDQLVIGGYSLGSGVASKMAAEVEAKGLFLIAPYTSLATVAAGRFKFPPLALLVTDKYDTIGRLNRIDEPMLIIHGEGDRVIPVSHSRRLAALRPDAQMHILAGHGHAIAWHADAHDRIADWLSR